MKRLVAWLVERPTIGWPQFFACWALITVLLTLVGAPFLWGMLIAWVCWAIVYAWRDAWDRRDAP